jgi:GNAT superfamily N-acetyltransferase
MNTIEIVAMPEYAISAEVCSQLQILLGQCFPDTFGGRTYFKQLPHFRLVAMDKGLVVAQIGIDGRVVTVGGTIVSIFGLIDLAVHPTRRGKRIGTQLLAEAERIARAGE